jgi:hypothetical protein
MAAAGFLLLGQPRSIQAMPCFTNLSICYQDAAARNSMWARWAAGLDCDLSFLVCAREDLLGY